MENSESVKNAEAQSWIKQKQTEGKTTKTWWEEKKEKPGKIWFHKNENRPNDV